MLNFEQAKEIAMRKIDNVAKQSNIPLSMLEDSTETFEYGWIFFYQSTEYVTTGDLGKLVGGNAPILIDKFTGHVFETGTGFDISYYIDEYCKFKQAWYP
jgi:hypothetical protein